jgi:hypothetical protein
MSISLGSHCASKEKIILAGSSDLADRRTGIRAACGSASSELLVKRIAADYAIERRDFVAYVVPDAAKVTGCG